MSAHYDDEDYGYGMGEEPALNEGLDSQEEYVAPEQFIPPPDATQVDESGFERKLGVVGDLATLTEAASTGDAHTILTAIEQFSKSQLVRFLDVSVVGPLLLYWAYKPPKDPLQRTVMGLIGLGTVIYNGRNFLKNRNILQGHEVAYLRDQIREKI